MESLKERISNALLRPKPTYLNYYFTPSVDNHKSNILSEFYFFGYVSLDGPSRFNFKVGTIYKAEFLPDFLSDKDTKIVVNANNVSLNFKRERKNEKEKYEWVEVVFPGLEDFINPELLEKKGVSYLLRYSFNSFNENLRDITNFKTSLYFRAFYDSFRLFVNQDISHRNEDIIVDSLRLIRNHFDSVDKDRLSLHIGNEINESYLKLCSDLESFLKEKGIVYSKK